MNDTNLLINISKDLATNTEATKGIEEHLRILNGKVARQVTETGDIKTEISKLKARLLIVGTVAATLLLTQGSELINFILKII